MTNPGHFHTVAEDLREPTRALRQAIPDTWGAFTRLHKSAMEDGELPRSIKELMALVIAVHDGCDGCVAYHARSAAAAGATEAEVSEALGVALLMGGGPVSVWAPRALAAFREFEGPGDSPADGG